MEDEVADRLPVARQRQHGDPLVGAVVAGAARAELDGRHPRLEERAGVGGAVAADAQRLAAGQPRGDVAERHDVRVRARHEGGLADERARDLDVRDRPDLLEDVTRILVRQIADVDDHGALVRDLVQRVPAVDPAEVDRRAVEQLGGLARERQGLDSAEHVDGLQHRVVAQPRRRAVRGAAADHDPAREHALGLDADVQLGRLAGDREVADEALAHHLVRRAHVQVLGLLVGRAQEAHADARVRVDVVQRAHHRGERALHVVGAAADQPVALDTRLELLRVAGHDVEVPVQHDRGRVARAHLGGQHRQAVEVVVLDVDLARLEPALDEARRRAQSVDVRGVIGDQALGQGAFVHPAQSIGGGCQDFGSGRHGVPPESSASPRSGKSWSPYVQPGSAVAKTAGKLPVAAENAHPVATLAPEAGGPPQHLLLVPGEAQADAVAARHLLALAGVAAGRRDDLARLRRHPEVVGRLLELGLQ